MKSKNLINYNKEAFSLPMNLVFLSVMLLATIGSFMTNEFFVKDLLPKMLPQLLMFTTASVEMTYMGLMPYNLTFRKAVDAKYARVTQALDQQFHSLQTLKALSNESLQKYYAMNQKKKQIEENFVAHQTHGMFVEAYLEKLAFLESFYVELLHETELYHRYLNADSLNQLNTESKNIQDEIKKESSEKVNDMYRKRLDLIEKRKDKIKTVQENLKLATIQLATLEDTVNYLMEQSLTLNNPEEINYAIDSVLNQVEIHQSSISDIDSIVGGDMPVSAMDSGSFSSHRQERTM